MLTVGDSGDGASMRSVNALLFPVDELHPRLVNLNCTIHQTDAIPHPLKAILVRTDPLEQYSMTSESSLYLAFTTAPPADGPDVNLSARQLTHGQAAVRWRGNLVGFRTRDVDGPHSGYLPATMDDLPAFVEFLAVYHPPRFTRQHLFDSAAPFHHPGHDNGFDATGPAGSGSRLPAGEIEDVLAYQLGTRVLPRFLPNAHFTLDRIPILDQMLDMCLPLPNAIAVRSRRGGTYASNAYGEPLSPAWSETTTPEMVHETVMPHRGGRDTLEEEREDLAALEDRLHLTLRRLASAIPASDTIRKEGDERVQETALCFSQQALSAQRVLIESYSRAKLILFAIVVVFLVVTAGGADRRFGVQSRWDGTIPEPFRKVVEWSGSVLGNTKG